MYWQHAADVSKPTEHAKIADLFLDHQPDTKVHIAQLSNDAIFVVMISCACIAISLSGRLLLTVCQSSNGAGNSALIGVKLTGEWEYHSVPERIYRTGMLDVDQCPGEALT
ncbi:hypothetical protein [Rhizobium sp. P28RR-XV]|uniref:hypothetical protein n=1 Tax=Rhizobium sp. P28RR-XV TaxID=2726737 RepID=UPI0014570D3D|nr:hypothetical protein [Rhizobium sp. P28RR-XV]NLR89413.1 hypothetical protein [Rhizobium sp. P28RR-XV]